MSAIWKQWKPIDAILGMYCLESITDNLKEFRLVLYQCKDPKQKIHILFESWVRSCRYTNESFRVKTLASLHNAYPEISSGWSFFTVENSSYLNFLSDESNTWSDELDLIHYCIIGEEWVIDIVATYEPRVEFYINGNLIQASREYLVDED